MIKNNINFYNAKTADTLNQKFDAIFPTWTTIVATIISVIILMIVLTKLFYNPVKKMVEARKKFIQSNINSAIKQNEEAMLDRNQASKKINEAHIIASNIVSIAKTKAEKIINENIINAKDEANRIVQFAHEEAKKDKELFEVQAKKEMISIALEAAKHVVEKEVDGVLNRKLVKDFIKEKYFKKEKNDS